jgi:hypothetical protein
MEPPGNGATRHPRPIPLSIPWKRSTRS